MLSVGVNTQYHSSAPGLCTAAVWDKRIKFIWRSKDYGLSWMALATDGKPMVYVPVVFELSNEFSPDIAPFPRVLECVCVSDDD
jgi:hypothetical protein